jgi:two-component system alkaline phosphatase synthesis response regulator PhoP
MHKIEIVEDDQAIREMYKFKLESSDYDVYTAENGQAGLELAETIKPDLILLDIKMPIMNGDEMLKKLRQEVWGALTKVIILTNLSRDEAPKILNLLRVERYIIKAHYTPKEVLKIIEEVLS